MTTNPSQVTPGARQAIEQATGVPADLIDSFTIIGPVDDMSPDEYTIRVFLTPQPLTEDQAEMILSRSTVNYDPGQFRPEFF